MSWLLDDSGLNVENLPSPCDSCFQNYRCTSSNQLSAQAKSQIEKIMRFVGNVMLPEYKGRNSLCPLTMAKQGGGQRQFELHCSNCTGAEEQHLVSHTRVEQMVERFFESEKAFYSEKKSYLNLNNAMWHEIYCHLTMLSKSQPQPVDKAEDKEGGVFWWLRVFTRAIGLSMQHKGLLHNDQHKEATCIFMATLLCLVEHTTSDIVTRDSAQMLAYVNACRCALAYRYNDRMNTKACKYFVLEKRVSMTTQELDAANVLATVMVPCGMHSNEIPPAREMVLLRLIRTIALCKPEFKFHLEDESQIMDQLGVGLFHNEYAYSKENPDIFHKCKCCLKKKELTLDKSRLKNLSNCIKEKKLFAVSKPCDAMRVLSNQKAQPYSEKPLPEMPYARKCNVTVISPEISPDQLSGMTRVETHPLGSEMTLQLSTQPLSEVEQPRTNHRPCKRQRRDDQTEQPVPASVVAEPALNMVATSNVLELGETDRQLPSTAEFSTLEDCDLMNIDITDDHVFQVLRDHESPNHLTTGDEVMLTEVERKCSHGSAEQNGINDGSATCNELSFLDPFDQAEDYAFVRNLGNLLEGDLDLEGCREFMCN